MSVVKPPIFVDVELPPELAQSERLLAVLVDFDIIVRNIGKNW